jgi:hypothetical protein
MRKKDQQCSNALHFMLNTLKQVFGEALIQESVPAYLNRSFELYNEVEK